MPDAGGQFKGMSVPRVPWHEDNPDRRHNKQMPFTKHTQSEQVEVVSPEDHSRIGQALKKVGKTSLDDCTEKEKQDVYFRDGLPPADD